MTQSVDNKRYVIFDTDMGTDDAWAFLMLLKAEKYLKNIKILAVTCVFGNTSLYNAIRNTYHILRSMDRSDIPMYRGANESLVNHPIEFNYYHGKNGMGDVEFWKSDYPSDENELVQPENAAHKICDLIMKYPNQISLIGVGPLTNIALAVKLCPAIKDKVKNMYLMGGNYKGKGNISSCAEFNFYADPEAAHIVLNSFECPITVVPWESCLEHGLSLEWRFETFKNLQCAAVQLLNKAEEFVYTDRIKRVTYRPCDAYLTAVFLFPDKCIKKQHRNHVTVELHGFHTRGQMILDHLGNNDHNVTIIELLNEDEFQKALLWTATA